jgi:hypothetical protein
MTWKDKLEIGLKDDAAFRHDNVPDFQKTGDSANGGEKTDRSPEEPQAREDAETAPSPVEGTADHPAIQPEKPHGGRADTTHGKYPARKAQGGSESGRK